MGSRIRAGALLSLRLFQPHTKDRATTPPPRPPGLVVPVSSPSRRGESGQTTTPSSLRGLAPHPCLHLGCGRSLHFRSLPPLKSPPRPPRADTWSRLFVSALRPDVRPIQSNRGRVEKPEAETQGEIFPTRSSRSAHLDSEVSPVSLGLVIRP